MGAKYVPLDGVDFEPRAEAKAQGWPIGGSDLRPSYARALVRCGFSGWRVTEAGLEHDDRPPLPDLPTPLVAGRYLLASRDALLAAPLAALDRDHADGGRSRIVRNATVLRLHADDRGGRVSRATVGAPGGGTATVSAQRFVLAGGAVENARLLLHSRAEVPDLRGVEAWLGRGFMEHPRDASLQLRPGSGGAPPPAWLDEQALGDGTSVLGRIGLDAAVVREIGLNASATLLARRRPWSAAAARRLGRLNRPPVRRWLGRPGHGWSAHPHPGAVFDGFTVLLNLEQSPHPANRIALGAERDSFGVPRPVLHWTWREDDAIRRARLREVFAAGLRAMDIGEMSIDPSVDIDPNAHHHAGTTRMATSAADGVVDPDGRVHGVDGLYVTGASVFPSCGFANPLLTIVALALRLADHLRT